MYLAVDATTVCLAVGIGCYNFNFPSSRIYVTHSFFLWLVFVCFCGGYMVRVGGILHRNNTCAAII